jgi:uncharacterized radical SAM superfamily protein
MQPSATVPTPADAERRALAWQARLQHHGRAIRFYRPTHTLPVSLTGAHCGLNCAHCGGFYLQHMHPIEHASTANVRSCLISGGCDAQGRVPVTAHLAQVAALHATLRMNWHVGMIDEDTMAQIAPHVDVISFDVVGDAETSREVYGLDVSLSDYVDKLVMLRRYARVVPHVTLGLRGGHLSGEYQALDALAKLQVETLILNILIPTPGTRYAECSPPTLKEVEQLFATARLAMPESRLILGCMRPRGDYGQAVDELAARVGMNGIVNPTQRALRTATDLGLSIEWGDECCAL